MAMRYWLKRCPRCHTGDLHEEKDVFGAYIGCVQCGHILQAAEEAALLGWREPELSQETREAREIAA